MVERLDLDGLKDPETVRTVGVLERGGVVTFPELPFELMPEEVRFLDPALLRPGVKNISLDPTTGALGGTRLDGPEALSLKTMIARYAAFASEVLAAVAPSYGPALQRGRTSFRPGPVDTRVLSPRKDDRRLHLDAFPSNPVQGRRILRVFTNVDPEGRPRVWELGEENVAELAARYAPISARGGPAVALQERLGVIKGRRTDYDAAMLTLHDRAKLDDAWQASAARLRLAFPAGATWIIYTDAVLHAALSGQNAFEQTWLLPISAMSQPERSPVRTLEAVAGRRLV